MQPSKNTNCQDSSSEEDEEEESLHKAPQKRRMNPSKAQISRDFRERDSFEEAPEEESTPAKSHKWKRQNSPSELDYSMSERGRVKLLF